MKITLRKLLSILAILFLIVGFTTSALQLFDNAVQAYSCSGSCNLPPGGCPCKKYNAAGHCVSYTNCGNNSCGVKMSNGEYSCSNGQTAACTCVGSSCKKSGAVSCTNLGAVCSCSCQPVGCPPGVPPNKFMTKPKVTGYGVSCGGGGCSGNSYACDPVHVNAEPSCSILPASISMTREDAPKQISLTATDPDYGDTVHVTKVSVVDTAGNLKSCVKVSTLGGGILENTTVKAGSDNPAATSQTTSILVDPRESHGIFDNIGGQSVCSGFIEVDIIDVDSDGAGGPDSSSQATCKVAVSVTNQAPQLTDVSIYDKDQMTSIRDMGASSGGDLVDGRAQLFVGSLLTTQSKSRASTCNEALSLIDPIKCPGGAENYTTAISQRRNPLSLEFTVSDANGLNDIMQAGLWIQQISQNANDTVVPPVNTASGIRHSFQAIYSENENLQVVSSANRWNLVSRACLGNTCGPKQLDTSTKQTFTALAFISGLSSPVSINGNIKVGNMQWASQRSWQSVGFPDCMNSVLGCVGANVPATAKTAADTTATDRNNYDWAISADDTHLICFKSDSNVPTVVGTSTPVICPVGCAACLKKEGVSTVASDPNALKFKFGIYFNDKDGGQGMPAGDYAVFLSALDKVAVPLNNVSGQGAEGWIRFTRNGAACTGATCPAGTNYSILYDPVAPTVNNVTWTSTLGNAKATVSISDNASGSGIGGVTNQFMARQEMLDGEPLGDRTWANDASGVALDGKNRHTVLAPSATSIALSGFGLAAGEEIVTGTCVYDRAGNMGCGRNGTDYVFLGPWLKTSYGDIYSVKGSGAPFNQTLPSNSDSTDNTKTIYSPFNEQIFTAGTGILMTGGSAAQGLGMSGGYVLTATQNSQLGFKANYRTPSSSFNVYGHIPTLQGSEFERLLSAAKLNCDLMNTSNLNTCNTDGDLSEVGAASFNVLSVGSQTVTDITCKQTNAIFVTGTLTINGQVAKDTVGVNNGCLFVLSSNAKLIINDTPSDSRPPAGDGKGSPFVDKFDAAIVANSGALIQTTKGARGATTKSTDRLEFRGWLYSAGTTPIFKRDLAPVDNRRYPAEWIKYDATLLDLFRPLLGVEKTVDLTCGTSTHVLCLSKN